MTAEEKNAIVSQVRDMMNAAIALVIAEVFSGLAAAIPLMASAAALLRQVGLEQEAVAADERAKECAGILLIPWPFIYIGSNAWISAVAQLRDSLPQFVDLQPVDLARRSERGRMETERRNAQAQARWDALSTEQRSILSTAKISEAMLRSLGGGTPPR